MCQIAVKFVPRLLTNDQKQQHVNMCLELREKANEDPTSVNISRIIIGDESWIYCYDPETKQQSLQWNSTHSPSAKKAQQVQSSTKSMLIVFFDMRGIVHCEFVPRNTVVKSDFYCDVLRRLRDNVQRKSLEFWRNHNWLHHDNQPAHMSLKSTEFVTNNNVVIVSQPPCSPVLVPCHFALLSKWKMKLKGQQFEIGSDIQRESEVVLDSVKENDYDSAFEAWKKYWAHCIHSKGDYI
jgi:histone-lysine N-methyltransferase SETMAR